MASKKLSSAIVTKVSLRNKYKNKNSKSIKSGKRVVKSAAAQHEPAQRNSRASSTKSTDGWPNPRGVFFRPARSSYVRKIDRPPGCVFCNAAEMPHSLETLCIYKSESSMLLLNKYPYNSGHLLVMPRRHVGRLLDLTDEEYRDLHHLLRESVQLLESTYEPQGLNLGLNHGAVAGAGIPDHLHYHLVPRWAGDLNFFPLIAETKVVIETLEQSYSRLTKALGDQFSKGKST